MKTRVLITLIITCTLIFTLTATISPISAQCDYNPSNPHAPCDDLRVILDSLRTQIEKINGAYYDVSEPVLPNSSVYKIIFHDVEFSSPYRHDPPRYTYSDVTFSDGTEETLRVLFDYPVFTEHVKPQAGFTETPDGIRFLVSMDLKELSPLKQFKSGIPINEIICKEDLVLLQKSDGSPACVMESTKQKLIERDWAETKSSDEIKNNSDLIKQNIARIEDGHISLYPENMCANLKLFLPTEQDIQRYKNDEKGLTDANILQITSEDLKEIPDIQELIHAVHSIEFPYNKYSSAYLDGLTLVEYELFLMEKSMKKYGDSQGDYFMQLDGDYEERLTNPAKQGLTNHFESPVIVYNDSAYSIGGTYFWTSNEHEPRRMGVYPQDAIKDDEKFIMLTDEDMELVPKIKDAIENIGTVKESIFASKGLPEDQWNQYREWFEQKSQDRLNSDKFRLIQHDDHLYSIRFGIC